MFSTWIHPSMSSRFYIFISILFLFQAFTVVHCMMSRASREDALRSFKSYSDITMFHYTVPREVLRVTWQFSAFMNDPTCQPRKVYILLRFGSYPIIPVNNQTFPENGYTKHNSNTIVTTFTTSKSKNATIVPIYGPQAGDWFIGAYMSHWDERVQMQGLGHKCRYSIGMIALGSQVDQSIENIPIGYEIGLRTSATTTYYKIYIPSGTWSFRLFIWNCSFALDTLPAIRKYCIENISLKARSLPISDHFHLEKSVSLATDTNHTIIESSPYEDSYYYLSIVSSSIVEFNVKIDITECPIRMVEKYFTAKYINTALNFNSLKKSSTNLIKRQLQYFKNENSSFYDTEDFCMPRHQLVRLKYDEPFSTVYFLQGYELLSTQIKLIPGAPMMMQFDILPLIDIGGTLDISMHLETEKLSSHLSVEVTTCVQRGRIPKFGEHASCQNGTLSMHLSSSNKHNASLLIVYPQPDTWYIITHATCHDYYNPVRCLLDEISVLLNVSTKKCMFPDPSPCGDYGVCEEIQKNGLHYTTCNCFEGYAGWGCTDVPNNTSLISSRISSIMLILSNVFFLPAIYIAVKRKMYTEGFVYLATTLFSSLYHACDRNNERFCIVRYEVLQYSDFFSGILAFWVTLVTMAELPSNFVPLCHMIGVFVVMIGVQIDKLCLLTIMVPLLIGIFIPIFTHVHRNVRAKRCKRPNGRTLMGLLFAIAGLLLYSFVETEGNYGYVHSVWHIVIAMSLIFLLPQNKQTSSLLKNTSESNDNKSWRDIKIISKISFTIVDQDH